MGIHGLASYISKSSSLQPHKLQNTCLVIDGHNLSYNIYYSGIDNSWIYGGAYDAYAKKVFQFFNNLLKCNVTPLVVIDGSYDDSKLETVLNRLQRKIRTASTVIKKQKLGDKKFAPPLRMKVFIQVLKEMRIKHVQCLIEADTVTAAIARALNCPVLTTDSDFYLFGTMVIPFYSLAVDVERCPTGNALNCKIFQFKYLLKSFPGLNEYKLSLIAVLLGNDIINYRMFMNFLRRFELHKGKSIYSIEEIFRWLSKNTLEEAIIEITSMIPQSIRQEVLEMIEANINSYTRFPAVDNYIKLLDASKYVVNGTIGSTQEMYKFNLDIRSLPYKETQESHFTDTTQEENYVTEIRNILLENKKADFGEKSIYDTLPEWFLNDYQMARFPGCFLTIINSSWYVPPIQVDNVVDHSSSLIALHIFKVIFGLLSSAVDEKDHFLKYVVRDQCGSLKHYEVQGMKTVPLLTLRDLPVLRRKEILDNTLLIRNVQCIDELLPEWKLYIACLKYCTDKKNSQCTSKSYTYPIIFSILFNIIITKFGRQESLDSLQKLYTSLLSKEMRNMECFDQYYCKNLTISQAHKEIKTLDCLLAAPFFMKHTKPQPIKYLDASVLHWVAEFQICLLYCIDLNALLGYPYVEVNIATLFNGPLIYNLCVDFRKCKNVDDYVKGILVNSPSLLNMFNVLVKTLDCFRYNNS